MASSLVFSIGVGLNVLVLRAFTVDTAEATTQKDFGLFDTVRDLDLIHWSLLALAVIAVALTYQQWQLRILRFLTKSPEEARIRSYCDWRVRRHKARLEKADELHWESQKRTLTPDEQKSIRRTYRRYPKDRDQIRSNLLANLVCQAEEGPWLGLDLDLELVGPSLFSLLSEQDSKAIHKPRSDLDTAVGLATSFTVVAGLTLSVLGWLVVASRESDVAGPLAIIAAAAAIAGALAYSRALEAAIAYKEGIEITMLLHRFKLLEQLRLPLPKTNEAEPELFRQAVELIRLARSQDRQERAVEDVIKFDHDNSN